MRDPTSRRIQKKWELRICSPQSPTLGDASSHKQWDRTEGMISGISWMGGVLTLRRPGKINMLIDLIDPWPIDNPEKTTF
jgi:hypothetical protein